MTLYSLNPKIQLGKGKTPINPRPEYINQCYLVGNSKSETMGGSNLATGDPSNSYLEKPAGQLTGETDRSFAYSQQ